MAAATGGQHPQPLTIFSRQRAPIVTAGAPSRSTHAQAGTAARATFSDLPNAHPKALRAQARGSRKSASNPPTLSGVDRATPPVPQPAALTGAPITSNERRTTMPSPHRNSDPRPSSLAQAAAAYARAGLAVFPLAPRSKVPLIPKDQGGRGFHDATTDLNEIRAWWSATPNANIGVRPPDGVLVVDIDPRAGGDLQLLRILREHGQLPETWIAQTGSGGWHYWFTAARLHDIRAHIAPGVELKTHTKGYLVAPPSIHPNGRQYRWLTIAGNKPAAAPDWLRRAIQPPPQPALLHQAARTAEHSRYSLPCLVARINAAPEGRRNKVLYGALKDALLDANLDTFEPALTAAAMSRGLSAREVAATVSSVRRGGAV